MKKLKAGPSRQVIRHDLRLDAHDEINKKAGGEPRRIRRSMARALGNRRYAQQKGRLRP